MEQVLDWLNENENRAYPLLDTYNNKQYIINATLWKFPDDFIVDLKLVVSSFLLSDQIIYLKTITLTSLGIEILFGALDSNKNITTFNILFNEIQEFFTYKRNPDGCLAVFGKGLNSFIAACNNNTQTVEVNIPVEFSTCYEFRNAWLGVRQITTFPEKQTDATNYITPLLSENIGLQNVNSSTILTGDVKFLEGYNFRVIIRNNLIDLEVIKGNGLKTNCSTHFISSEYLDCADIVSYINGIPPDEDGNFKILQGANIVLTPGKSIANFNDSYNEQANNNTLFVSMMISANNLCNSLTPSIL
jgi:hypothetical protein